MEGVIEDTRDFVQEVCLYEEAIGTLHAMKPEVRSIIGADVAKLEKALAAFHDVVERVSALSGMFKKIKHDVTAMRQVVQSGSSIPTVIEVPLVFRSIIPAHQRKAIWACRIRGQVRTKVKVSAKVPNPPVEALKALAEHKGKFNAMEVWWVPKEIHVTEPKPDPILVGVVTPSLLEPIYFDVFRWVDEGVEDAYWAREAY